MTLPEYLKSTGENGLAFARRTGIPASTVYAILAGRKPDWPTMDRIDRATEGSVKPNDFQDTATAAAG